MLSLIASAGLGAMIGLIRQWSEQTEKPENADYAGVRTFTCWSLLGCVGAYLSETHAPAALPVILAVVGAHFVIGRSRAAASGTGGTTFAASLLTVLTGALVAWQRHDAAVLLSGLLVVLLGLKGPIHAWTRKFTETDIRGTLQFVAITAIILPLVPDRAFGPFDGFNPRSTWMMVVLISGVGFSGYVLMRALATRAGIFLSSLLGGLASSTATTLAFSRRSREDPANAQHYAMAVAIACTVMLPRLLVVVGLVNRELARQLVLPFVLMVIPGISYVTWNWWRQRRQRQATAAPVITNPLNLTTALKFAVIYALISFLVKTAVHFEHLQDALLPLAFLSGLTDVDAIALSVARNLSAGEAALGLAAKAIVIAAIANSALKAGAAAIFGAAKVRQQVVVLMVVTIVAGMIGFGLVDPALAAGK